MAQLLERTLHVLIGKGRHETFPEKVADTTCCTISLIHNSSV